MQRDLDEENHIEVQKWRMTPEALVELLESKHSAFCKGKVQLFDDEWIFGIFGESYICEERQEITEWGGWRKYLAEKK